MKNVHPDGNSMMPRRDFLRALGSAAVGLALSSRGLSALSAEEGVARRKAVATVRGAFLYPPTESLKKAGYYSWPGEGFDAEGHHREYARRIGQLAKDLDMQISMNQKALSDSPGVSQFINEIKQHPPDGLLLIPFKKSEWGSILRIVEETKIPAVVLVTAGILLNPHINQLHRTPGVYLICSLDNFGALECGMKMIRTARWMKEGRIISLAGDQSRTTKVEKLGTEVVALPRARFAEEFRRTETDATVQEIARNYLRNARKVVEPSEADIVDAAKTYVVCKRILEAEQGDAIMMDCLGAIRDRQFPPPCMGFMSLRDEGIAAGCQNDLDSTLTMMLVQYLFDKPGFQQNASSETEKNRYYGAHCTCASKLNGTTEPQEPYILRNHAESGVGVAPQVLWRIGEQVTMAHYLSRSEPPEMIVYSGTVMGCHDTPPAGGCRTNVELTINEVADVCDVKGMHQTIFYGNYARQLRAFCQLLDIAVVT